MPRRRVCPFCFFDAVEDGRCAKCGTSVPKDVKRNTHETEKANNRHSIESGRDEDANGSWGSCNRKAEDRDG
jgi:hypothetical protein